MFSLSWDVPPITYSNLVYLLQMRSLILIRLIRHSRHQYRLSAKEERGF